MKVAVLAKHNQVDIVSRLIKKAVQKPMELVFFFDFSRLLAYYSSAKKKEIYMIFIDQSALQVDCINPFRFFLNISKPVPVCIYNDPFPGPTQRCSYWLSKNNFYYRNFSELQRRKFFNIFKKVEKLMLKEEYYKEITCILSPEKSENVDFMFLETYISGWGGPSDMGVTVFDTDSKEQNFGENKLIDSRNRLLKYFLDNKDKELSCDDLTCFLWDEISLKRKRSLYAYIKDLRKFLKECCNSKYQIIRSRKNHYKLIDN